LRVLGLGCACVVAFPVSSKERSKEGDSLSDDDVVVKSAAFAFTVSSTGRVKKESGKEGDSATNLQ